MMADASPFAGAGARTGTTPVTPTRRPAPSAGRASRHDRRRHPARRRRSEMADTICIVHLDTGLVDERSSDTLSADMPVDIADEAMRASIDRSGHLHYRGA